MSKFPVGAKWVSTNKHGDKATVSLNVRVGGWETWGWTFVHSDGSGWKGDWTRNKASCVEEVSVLMWIKDVKPPRFKRVKNIYREMVTKRPSIDDEDMMETDV